MAFTHQETVYNAATSGTNANVDLAGAPSSGELVVMYVHAGGPQTITPDADGGAAWTLGANVENPGSETARHGMWWKIAGGSEPTNMSATLGGSDNWGICVTVASSDTNAEVDSATNSAISGSALQYLDVFALRSQVVANDAFSVIGAGKDNRSSSQAYTQSDNSYTNVKGDQPGQITAMASRVYGAAEGKTWGATEDVRIDVADTADGSPDLTFSMHMSFVESSGGGGGRIMSSLAGAGGLAGRGGIAGPGGGLAGRDPLSAFMHSRLAQYNVVDLSRLAG